MIPLHLLLVCSLLFTSAPVLWTFLPFRHFPWNRETLVNVCVPWLPALESGLGRLGKAQKFAFPQAFCVILRHVLPRPHWSGVEAPISFLRQAMTGICAITFQAGLTQPCSLRSVVWDAITADLVAYCSTCWGHSIPRTMLSTEGCYKKNCFAPLWPRVCSFPWEHS